MLGWMLENGCASAFLVDVDTLAITDQNAGMRRRALPSRDELRRLIDAGELTTPIGRFVRSPVVDGRACCFFHPRPESDAHARVLTELNRKLVGVWDKVRVTQLVCDAVRELVKAEGATFVIRDRERVHYVAESAIAPLWKGKNFPIETCISGWSIHHGEVAAIPDIYLDARIPHDAYRPTFVRSLVMTPIGPGTPVAAVGAYWATEHHATAEEIDRLRALASAADVALAGVRAYELARRAQADAEQANRLKDQFLATVSHELRTPLHGIVAHAELLASETDLERVGRSAASILTNALTQARLVDDLLDMSKLQSGKLITARDPHELGALVRDAVTALSAAAAKKGVAVELDVREAHARVDPVRIAQVTWNLVSNAIKFTPPGGHVKVQLARRGGDAELVVTDDGEGIAPEFLPHVFDMFRQADVRLTREHGGLGIGLAIAQQLVQLHDGVIEARSEGRGRGAQFLVRLATCTPAPKRRAARHDARLDGKRVLLVDDTSEAAELLGELLEQYGAIVSTADNGEQALRMAQRDHFDLVISDIGMPVMDGYQFMSKLRGMERYRQTPSVALTGFGRTDDVRRASDAGFDAHLTKPIEVASLLDVVSRIRS